MIGSERITKKNYKKIVGLRWMPASIESTFPAHVCVKYGRFDKLATKVQQIGKLRAFYWQFPDRQVRVSYSKVPDTWGDSYVDLSVFGKETIFETDFAMINTFKAPDSMSKVKQAISGNYIVVGDSGGFQIVSGVADFVHPKKIIGLANELVDFQICLDLPPGGISDWSVMEKSARVLALNNKYFAKHRKPDTLLMNVSHGNSISLRKKWLDVVLNEGPAFDGLAVGGLQSSFQEGGMIKINPIEFVKHAMFVMNYTKDVFHYYHFLGVASDWQVILLQLLAHRFGKLVTVDSSSHIQMANYGFFKLVGKSSDRIGQKDPKMWDLNTIPCSCAFCTPYYYKEVFLSKSNTMQGHNTEAISRLPFMYHAMFEKTTPQHFAHRIVAPIMPKAGQAVVAAMKGSWKNISEDDESSKYDKSVAPPVVFFKSESEHVTKGKKLARYKGIVDKYLQLHGKAK